MKSANRLLPVWPFFTKADDSEELRRAQGAALAHLGGLAGPRGGKAAFRGILRRLQVRDYDLYELCFNARQSPAQDVGALPTEVVGARVSADDILDDIFGDAQTAAPPPPPAEGVDTGARDTAAVFAGLVLEYWISRLRELAGDAEARSRYGLPARELDQFCHELITAATRCRVRENLESELRRSAAYSNMARERLIWKQVSLAADAINAFVDWLDFDPRFKDQAARTILFGGKSISLFSPPPEFSGEPQIAEEESPYDRLWYTDWLRALAYAVIANLNFDGEQTVDPEQNNRLRHILQAFKE